MRCAMASSGTLVIAVPSTGLVVGAVFAGLLASAVPAPAQVPAPASAAPPPVDPGAELVVLFEGEHLMEGPSVAPDGTLYFTELDFARGGTLWRLELNGGEATVFRRPSGVAVGTAIDPNGLLLTAEVGAGGGRRIAQTELGSGRTSTVADRFQGRPLHGANDLVLDEAGRIYFTEYAYLGPDEVLHRPGSGVYRVDPDGTVERILADVGRPNGIAVAPDGNTLYVGTERFDVLGRRAILAFDLSAEGRVRFRSILVSYEPETSRSPDGMAVDVDGNLYVALFSRRGDSGVAVYGPDGEEAAFIPTPGPATNLAFGLGEDATSLYVTAGERVYRLRTNRPGYHPGWRVARSSPS